MRGGDMIEVDHFRAVPGGIMPDDEPNCDYCSRCLMPFFDDECVLEIRPYGTDVVIYSYCDGCRHVQTGHC